MAPPWHIGQVAVHNPFVPYAYVGVSGYEFGGANAIRTTLALPTEARDGDLLVLGINGRTQASCSDSRFQQIGLAGPGEGPWGWAGGVWVGYAGPPTVPVLDGGGQPTGAFTQRPIDLIVQSAGGGISQFSSLACAAFRGVEIGGLVRNPIRYDPNRLVQGEQQGGVPAVPGKGSGAIAVMMTVSGFTGAYGTTSWKAPYTWATYQDGSYNLVYYGKTDQKNLIPATASAQNDTNDGWRHWVIGLK